MNSPVLSLTVLLQQMFDLAANVSEGVLLMIREKKTTFQLFIGIRNTTTVFDGPQRDRVRIPRHVPFDGVLAVSERLATRNCSWLISICAISHIHSVKRWVNGG